MDPCENEQIPRALPEGVLVQNFKLHTSVGYTKVLDNVLVSAELILDNDAATICFN